MVKSPPSPSRETLAVILQNRPMKYCLLIITIFLLSCSKNANAKEELEIQKTLTRFPFLKPQKDGKYVLERKIDLDSIKLSLYQSNDGQYNEIIVINNKNNCVSIPLFSNEFRDYWNFPNETSFPNISRTNTTFEAEYINGMKKLNLYDLNNFFPVSTEILQSLLHCKTNIETDSLAFYQKINPFFTNVVKPENEKDCLKRTIENFKTISNDSRKKIQNHIYYYDEARNRIYRFENTEKRENWPKANINIKSLRQDCITELITL